jgi:FixJ family two-component response regulator
MPETAPVSRTHTAAYLIAEPSPTRERLRAALAADGFDSRTYASVEEFLARTGAERGGCVVLDLVQIADTEVKWLNRLTSGVTPGPSVVVTAQTDVRGAVRAMQAGAADVVPKPFTDETLRLAVRRSSALARAARRRWGSAPAAVDSVHTLTAREREILELLAAGQGTRQVAMRLCRSAKTIQKHTANLMKKLDVHNRVDLVRRALQAGLVDL